MTREDVRMFSRALREAFPGLIFVSMKHWKSFADWDYWKAAVAERERREAAGEERQRVVHRLSDPTGKMPTLWDDLAVDEETDFYGWIPPRDWIPEWGPADGFGERLIVNRPERSFVFMRGRFETPERSPFVEQASFADPPTPRTPEEPLLCHGAHLMMRYRRHDEEGRAFALAVFRILGRQAVDRFITIDWESRRALSLQSKRNRRYDMAARGAEAWALERRHNYFFSGMKSKPASYPFAAGDVFSAEELAAYKARQAAELEKTYRWLLERDKREAANWRTPGAKYSPLPR